MLARPARTLLSLVLCFATLALAAPAAAQTPTAGQAASPPRFPQVEVTARSAVVIDDATGEVVFDKDSHARRAPASITKIATALTALEYDSPTRVVTVHVDWYDLSDSTLMGVRRGERLSIEDLLYGLLLPSGNDAAVAIARAVAGSDTNFVALMNAEAQKLGLKDTHFVNPHGLDEDGHYTSAYDIAQMARYAMQIPEFAKVVDTRTIEFHGLDGSYFPLRNINKFLWYYPGADGVKHGYTDNAGQTLVGTAVRNGHRAYVALMGSWNYTGDAQKLMDAYFATYGSQDAPVSYGASSLLALTPPSLADVPPHQEIDVPPSRAGYVPADFRAQ